MKKTMWRIVVCCAVLMMLLTVSALAGTEVPYKSYTYWTDYPGVERKAVASRPMYEPLIVIDSLSLEEGEFASLTDICTDEQGNVYVLDGGSSAVYIFDKAYNHLASIGEIRDGSSQYSFSKARGIYVSKNGDLYIADTENARVLKSDKDGILQEIYTLPDSGLIPDDFQYRPIKLAVDSKGYLYVLSDGSYYGAIQYSPLGEFCGFFGSNTIGNSVLDVLTTLWNKIFMTNAKRAASERRIPYQFTDLWIDNNDFVFTITGSTDSKKLQYGQIHCFNPGGGVVDSTDSINFADVSFNFKSQDLLGIAVDKDSFIYAVDSAFGRVFLYDSEYRMLSAFGGGMGEGEQSGTFVLPCAISLNGDDVLVCDSVKNSVTVFSITEYGRLVKDMRLLTINGEYEQSYDGWMRVMSLDQNNQAAYIGLARAEVAKGNYSQALNYARQGLDKDTYAHAFKYIRRDFLSRYFPVVFFLVLLAVVGVFVVTIKMSRRKTALISNEYIRVALTTMIRPFDSFGMVKERNLGSKRISILLVAVFYVITVMRSILGGYLFVDYNPAEFNSLQIFVQTVGFVVLGTVVNWAVSALMGGIGRVKEIFVVISYSLLPYIIGNIFFILLSNVLLSTEAGFLYVLQTLSLLYTVFILIVGLIKIHDFSFSQFVASTVLTVCGMLVVLFLLFIIIVLFQQLGGFVLTLIREIVYR